MKVRASERDASSLAIAQRAQPKFDGVKVASNAMQTLGNADKRVQAMRYL